MEDLSLIDGITPALTVSRSNLISRGLKLAKEMDQPKGATVRLVDYPVHQARPRDSTFENFLGMKFVYIPPGVFMMGSPPDEAARKDHELLHQVRLTKGFYLQTTQVTVGQWRIFARETGFLTEAETRGGAFLWLGGTWQRKAGCYWDSPDFVQSESHPVTCVSWDEAQAFIEWLRLRARRVYRLPAEAEWEYACRAGSSTRFSFGEGDAELPAYGWYWENSDKKTHPVAQKEPNAWGLYDMHGNVWELCQDSCEWKNYGGRVRIITDTYEDGIIDPICEKGSFRTCRGGDWFSPPRACRSANRLICSPNKGNNVRGFRLALWPER